MVVGHTIQDQINGACDNRVLRVDVGMSKGCMDRQVEVLEIVNDGEKIWRLRGSGLPREEVQQGYKQRPVPPPAPMKEEQ